MAIFLKIPDEYYSFERGSNYKSSCVGYANQLLVTIACKSVTKKSSTNDRLWTLGII